MTERWYDWQKPLWKQVNGNCCKEQEKINRVWQNRTIKMGAEYRFVPVFPRVAPAPVQKETANCRLSHARPVPGGFSGRLAFDLVAETPVLFGQKTTLSGQEVTVHARLYEDGPCVAPGRAIKGLIRNVFGIATCSHFRPINGDHRFFSRNMDYTSTFANRTGRPKLSWLRPEMDCNNLKWKIHLFGEYKPSKANANVNNSCLAKLDEDSRTASEWNEKTIEKKHAAIGKILKNKEKCKKYCKLIKEKYLVTSGYMKSKRREALFPLPASNNEFPVIVDTTAIAAFLFANSEYKKDGADYPMGGKRKPSGNFALFLAEYLFHLGDNNAREIAKKLGLEWREVKRLAKRRDEPPGIPVYCWGEPNTPEFEMGTSQVVPKGPDGSVDCFLVPNTQEALPDGELDWTNALFGYAEDEKREDAEQALKSRLTFDFALADNAHEYCPEGKALDVTQGQPKASFDPFYLKRKDANGEPAVWAKRDNAVLSGYKRYPASRDVDLSVNQRSIRQGPENKTSALVCPVKKDAVYHCAVEFHNLHPLELGALLWAISFGDPEVLKDDGKTRYRHVAGRLRNKGLGRLRPARLKITELEQNPIPDDLRWEKQFGNDKMNLMISLVQAFEIHMGRFMLEDSAADISAARKEFYENGNNTITALLNSSDTDWRGEEDKQTEQPVHDKGKMFQVPKSEFNHFSNLRKLHYKKFSTNSSCNDFQHIMPGNNKTTILDEFFKPKGGPKNGPPEAGGTALLSKTVIADSDPLDTLINPIKVLRTWREQVTPQASSLQRRNQ